MKTLLEAAEFAIADRFGDDYDIMADYDYSDCHTQMEAHSAYYKVMGDYIMRHWERLI